MEVVSFIYGKEFKDNTKLCPKTRQLLLNISGFKTAMFSGLSRNSEIPPHVGPFKGVLRVHLGLIIPENSRDLCYIEVCGQRENWRLGEIIVFDDTHLHAAYNKTDIDRVVLFIDVVRPLPFPLNIINHI